MEKTYWLNLTTKQYKVFFEVVYFLVVWYHWLRSKLQNGHDRWGLISWFSQLGQKAAVGCGVSGFMEVAVAVSVVVRFVWFSFTGGVIVVIWAYNGVIVTAKSNTDSKKGIIALYGLFLPANLENKVMTLMFFILKPLFHPSAYFDSFLNFYDAIDG